MGPGDTDDLLRRVLSGDGEARGRLLEQLRPALVLWCASRMSARMKASYEPEDLAQEILVRVHRSIDGIDISGRQAFYGWIYTLGRNCLSDHADYLGAGKRRVRPPMSMTQTSPSTRARRREEVDRLMRAMDALEPEDREILTLLKLEERTQAEVASVQGRSVNAVRIHLCRALKQLQAGLEQLGAGGGGETSSGPVR